MQIIYKDGKKFLSLKHKKGEHICKHFVPVGDFCKNADNFLRLMNKYEERIYEYSKTNKCRFARIDRKYSFLLSIFAMQMALQQLHFRWCKSIMRCLFSHNVAC